MTEKHVRDLATKESEFKLKVWQDVADKLGIGLPTIFNAIAGRRLLPEPAVMTDHLLGGIIESIDGE